jgi:hypothetical protein
VEPCPDIVSIPFAENGSVAKFGKSRFAPGLHRCTGSAKTRLAFINADWGDFQNTPAMDLDTQLTCPAPQPPHTCPHIKPVDLCPNSGCLLLEKVL